MNVEHLEVEGDEAGELYLEAKVRHTKTSGSSSHTGDFLPHTGIDKPMQPAVLFDDSFSEAAM
eukprot:260731-Amphidinium_carterae.1